MFESAKDNINRLVSQVQLLAHENKSLEVEQMNPQELLNCLEQVQSMCGGHVVMKYVSH